MATPTAFQSAGELRLIALVRDVGHASAFEDACALAVEGLEALVNAPCAIRARDAEGLRTLAASAARGVTDWSGNDNASKIIPLGQAPDQLELLIAAATETPSARASVLDDDEWCDAVGVALGTALQVVHLRAHRLEAERRADRIERFSRALVAISDSATIHRTIVEEMARAVDAEIGAMAVYVPQENGLVITATHGYPPVLVEHVRIAPGEGVLGRVFATGEPIVVPKLGAMPGQVTRRRYRTDSYVALPLAGPDGVVAVVSLTDRARGGPFGEPDLAVLRQMAIPAALAVARELLRDRTNDLAHLATVDPLTGLFNRRYFETRLEQELQRQVRQPDDLSLLMLDLDNFKELNDRHGHLTGDLALREVAEILRRAVRIFDVCARYGGEEFVILMPGAGSSTALRIAERIRRQVEQHFATGLRSGVPVPLTVSVGVSTAAPSVTRDALVTQADAALLRAKFTGKNQVNLHEDGA